MHHVSIKWWQIEQTMPCMLLCWTGYPNRLLDYVSSQKHSSNTLSSPLLLKSISTNQPVIAGLFCLGEWSRRNQWKRKQPYCIFPQSRQSHDVKWLYRKIHSPHPRRVERQRTIKNDKKWNFHQPQLQAGKKRRQENRIDSFQSSTISPSICS